MILTIEQLEKCLKEKKYNWVKLVPVSFSLVTETGPDKTLADVGF